MFFLTWPIFKDEEDLIIFPYEEFLRVYDEISANLHIAGKVVEEVLADLQYDPRREFGILDIKRPKKRLFNF
ncbi:MAG TPA: hypothetical protein VGC02_04405 [Methanobacterium sp.]